MKKSILLLTVILLSALTVAMARTFYVEKAVNVKVKKTELQAGTELKDNAKITIQQGGVLVFVDRQTGCRWLVKKAYKGKIGKLAKPRDNDFWTISKSFFRTYARSEAEISAEIGATYREVMPGQDKVIIEIPLDSDPTFKLDNSVAITPDSISVYVIEE